MKDNSIIIYSEYFVTCYIGRELIEKVWASSAEDAKAKVKKLYFNVMIKGVTRL